MTLTRKILAGACLISGLAVAVTAYAGSGAGGPSQISPAVAKSRNARTITLDQCMSSCRSVQKDSSSCTGNCGVGKCYANPTSGNSYCVQ